MRRLPIFAQGVILSKLSQWRWRLAGIALVLAYLAQDALQLRWNRLYELQTLDWFKYTTGAIIFLYVAWQWSLFLLRLKGLRGRNLRRLMMFHQKSGMFAPLFFYLHSVQIGYGYLAALSWIFLTAVLVGTASPVGIRIRSKLYLGSWIAIHVMLAALTVILGLYHAYTALYYK